MSTQPSAQDQLLQAIINAIDRQVKETQEQVIKEAVVQFESRLRAAVGDVAVRASRYYSINSDFGGGTTITVRILGEKEKV